MTFHHLCVPRSGRKGVNKGAMTGTDDLVGGSPTGPRPMWNGIHFNLSSPVLPARLCPGNAKRVWVFGHCPTPCEGKETGPRGCPQACQLLRSHAGRLRSHGGSHAGAKSSIRCREYANSWVLPLL